MDKKKPLEKPTILLVEKNKQDEEVLVNIISSTYDYVTASSSDEVLAILQDADKRISAAIIGEEFARACLEEIRILPELEEFPVIVSVLGSNYELENELLELQVIDFIKKPFSERRVLNRLRTAVKLFNANRLIYELERDDLTGLYTRQVFLHKAETVRNENPHKKFCVIAFDFDNFKYSNTLYGEQKCNEIFW